MEHIGQLRDLEKYGVVLLTGEADSLGFRILCDLTTRGRKIVAQTLGLSEEGFAENWNQGTENVPHVASVMLSGESYQSIGVLALFDTGCHTVLVTETGVLFGLRDEEEFDRGSCHFDEEKSEVVWDRQPRVKLYGNWFPWAATLNGPVRRCIQHGPGPRRGDRNIHEMSGRAG